MGNFFFEKNMTGMNQVTNLDKYLKDILPASAVREHVRNLCGKVNKSRGPEWRRPPPARRYDFGDFADWSEITAEKHKTVDQDMSWRGVDSGAVFYSDIYLARWLHSAGSPRCKRFCMASPIESPPSNHRQQAKHLHSVGGASKILCHASAYVEPRTFVFGGLISTGCTNKLWSFCPNSGAGWEHMKPLTSIVPTPRFNHTLVSWEKKLILFGGDEAPGYLNDLWIFDTTSKTWENIPHLKEPWPSVRAGHTCATFGKRFLILMGGWRGCYGLADVSNLISYIANQVWSFDLVEKSWNLLWEHEYPRTSYIQDEGFKNTVGRLSPIPRHWHAAAVFDEWLYLHGGYGDPGVLGQVWRFHCLDHYWELVETKGQGPAPRCRHCAVSVNNRSWAILGGKDPHQGYFGDFFILDIPTHTWVCINLYSPAQSHDWWNGPHIIRQLPLLHCQAIAYDHNLGIFVITGGCDGESTALDSTILIKRFPAAVAVSTPLVISCNTHWRISCNTHWRISCNIHWRFHAAFSISVI